MPLPEIILQNQIYRFELLATLYARTQTGNNALCDLGRVAMEKGISQHDFARAFDYLLNEKLISNPINGSFSKITHLGIKAIEEVFKDTNKPSTYFPPYTKMIK
ncbi:MAG: hypothetical protein RMJ87_08495 [Cytophagales bacterium]|nr:hypothetical protein [Cytophagales bacterium]